MIDKDKEIRAVFNFCEKWAQSPLTPSYSRGRTSGLGDQEPAQKVYDHILSLQSNKATKPINFEEKLNDLYAFLDKAEQDQRKIKFIGTDFYNNLLSYINRSKRDISEGRAVQKKRK